MPNLKDAGANFLLDLGQKWQKNIIFNNFTLAGLKVTKLLLI